MKTLLNANARCFSCVSWLAGCEGVSSVCQSVHRSAWRWWRMWTFDWCNSLTFTRLHELGQRSQRGRVNIGVNCSFKSSETSSDQKQRSAGDEKLTGGWKRISARTNWVQHTDQHLQSEPVRQVTDQILTTKGTNYNEGSLNTNLYLHFFSPQQSERVCQMISFFWTEYLEIITVRFTVSHPSKPREQKHFYHHTKNSEHLTPRVVSCHHDHIRSLYCSAWHPNCSHSAHPKP